ncbi:PstS family phosphate ABC transporter substrate-binding protein [Ureibacillus sp. FSL K6-8385]|uniref:Phosphate-binding protein n=1 Tax=Ureibacillus terrenus TaxID=118246 RepID=A0A540V6E7_9BACL|nr:PstS family phosphate ABC transporter substrate-binding protein [Ureibacillus terrenus]MED3762908.1 PstS family phosphate ABC transporter substrate-binding protein [Ureibacillus terrenus]TQE92291.1 PstS family phosphate ABC transporter substrate-binding protein [Ureibacillus terrenus]
MKKWKYLSMTALLGSTLLIGACGGETSGEGTNSGNGMEQTENGEAQLTGSVSGDGSSTVAPITEALVEEYKAVQPNVQVSVGVSGTGGGFEKFIAGETDFSNASREMKEEEARALEEAGIEFTKFEIAYDGITVVVNAENDWAKNLTIEQLKEIWIEDGKAKKWSDIDPSWPDEEIVYYAPGTDSGTFDYFDEVVLEGEDLVRSAQLSEDDNVIVQGVASDPYAIGFFGYAYYLENKDRLKAVKVNGVEPTREAIEKGEYTPLSRPLFVFVNNAKIKDSEAFYDFMKFLLENAGDMAEAVGYIRLPEEKYEEGLKKLDAIK